MLQKTKVEILAFFLIIIQGALTTSVNCQTVNYDYVNKVYDDFIKTVTLDLDNSGTQSPILTLGSNHRIFLKFDDLLNEERVLFYRIVHCDKNWKPSVLREIEYLSGFNDERLRNYNYSINTRIPFLHYWLSLPNKDTNFKVSGNYLLIIYEDKIDYPILTRRFVIQENKLPVDTRSIYPSDVSNISFKQEYLFDINYEKFKMRNPLSEITLQVIQNDNWFENRVAHPTFFTGNVLKFNKLGSFDFWGLTEFREFDTRRIFNLGRNVDFIERRKDGTDITLTVDEVWRNKPYRFNFDFNGKFYIENVEALTGKSVIDVLDELAANVQSNTSISTSVKDSIITSLNTRNSLLDNNFSGEERDLRSDYVNVIFSYQDDLLDPDTDIYIMGALSDWMPKEEFKMYYDYRRKMFTTSVLLKQGYYNYAYGILTKDNTMDYKTLQGSWNDTENKYQTLIYYKGLGDLYDRVVGYSTFNSLELQTSN